MIDIVLVVFAVAAALVLLVGVFVGISWFVFHKRISRLANNVMSMPGLHASRMTPLGYGENVRFSTTDDLTLAGTYFQSVAARQGVLVFCHEFASDRWAAGPYIDSLCRQGFDVFAFDLRNHGDSDAMADYQPRTRLTPYEVDDITAAIDYVCSRDDADPSGVGLIGRSLGGSAALCAAARDSRVKAVMADSAFTFGWVLVYFMRRYCEMLAGKLAPIYAAMPDWFLEFYGRRVLKQLDEQPGAGLSFKEHLRRLDQPVLLIHGASDRYVPIDNARRIRRLLGRKCKLWVVPGAKHNAGIEVLPSKYEQRMCRFFTKHLGSDDTTSASSTAA